MLKTETTKTYADGIEDARQLVVSKAKEQGWPNSDVCVALLLVAH